MIVHKTIKNVTYAFMAQGLSFVLSIIMSLVVPRLLGLEHYAYWQLFMFYGTYAGFFHFGLVDGIYLRFGGHKYQSLDFSILNGQFRLLILVLSFFSLVIVFVGIYVGGDRGYVIIATSVYIFIYNILGFFGYLFQAVNDTQKYSKSILIDKSFFLIWILIMLVGKVNYFQPMVILYTLAKLISFIYLIWNSQEIFQSKPAPWTSSIKEAFNNIRVGIKLMISNVSSMLILGSGRMIIDNVWGIKAFGIYSLALSLSNFFMQFIGQVSMVLFPALRQTDSKQQRNIYINMRGVLSIIMPMVFFVYLPMQFIILRWLPQYAESIRAMILFLPICTYDGKMNILCYTYFKVLREENRLLRINIFSMGISLVLCVIASRLFHDINAVVLSMVIVIMSRSIISEISLAKMMGTKVGLQILLESLLVIVFVVSAWYLQPEKATLIFAAAYILFLLVNRSVIGRILNIISSIRNKKKEEGDNP